jgi:hypothetical protein
MTGTKLFLKLDSEKVIPVGQQLHWLSNGETHRFQVSGFGLPRCDMTDSHCSLLEIPILSYLPDSYKYRSGSGVSGRRVAKSWNSCETTFNSMSFKLWLKVGGSGFQPRFTRAIAVKNRSHNPRTTDSKLQSFFSDQTGRSRPEASLVWNYPKMARFFDD